MKNSFPFSAQVAAFAVALACLPGAWALSVSTNQTFTVQPGGRLLVEADRGSVDITTSDTSQVTITVNREVKRTDDKKAQEILDAHQITFAQDGDAVSVKAKFPKGESIWSRKGSNLSVKYVISVPKKFDLQIGTAGGSINVADIAGKLDLDTAGGSIHVGNVDGTVKADTAGGSIHVAGATGLVDADTAGGSIKLGKMGGAVNADTAGGSIRIESAAGPVKADTAGGSIELSGLAGPVDADTSGGSITARFIQAPNGESSLGSTGGGVTVYVADKLAFDVDAEAMGGGVKTEVPVSVIGKISRNEVRGTINGGGAKLKLRSMGGGIQIKPLTVAKAE
jgi:DUF4097 and DUF4098 domain-containing protein YvlB